MLFPCASVSLHAISQDTEGNESVEGQEEKKRLYKLKARKWGGWGGVAKQKNCIRFTFYKLLKSFIVTNLSCVSPVRPQTALD